MANTTQYTERDFINQLSQRLTTSSDWKVDADSGSGDMVIQDPRSGKRVFIEFQEGGQYGELPMSSVVSLNKQKNRLSGKDTLFLITFSAISSLLEGKLKELGIMAIARPSVDEVVGKLQFAMSA
jgi:hypothetical protein